MFLIFIFVVVHNDRACAFRDNCETPQQEAEVFEMQNMAQSTKQTFGVPSQGVIIDSAAGVWRTAESVPLQGRTRRSRPRQLPKISPFLRRVLSSRRRSSTIALGAGERDGALDRSEYHVVVLARVRALTVERE